MIKPMLVLPSGEFDENTEFDRVPCVGEVLVVDSNQYRVAAVEWHVRRADPSGPRRFTRPYVLLAETVSR